MSGIKACIFDLDGVIVDTAKYHFRAWRKLANDLGFDFTEEQNEMLKGVSRMESLRLILELGERTLPQQEMEALAEQKNTEYLAFVDQMTEAEILPGVSVFLSKLKSAGIPIVLGSASKNAVKILEKINLIEHFDAIIDGTKTSRSKPDPEVFIKGALACNTAHEHIVVFEDAPKGVQAAKAANMKAVGVGSADVLAEADTVISTFEGLELDFLNTL